MVMEKSNLFFTYLGKLKLNKENSEKDDNEKEEPKIISDEFNKVDNEWLQEYDLIYRSYSIEGY
jgi:hypothetical protein